MVFLGKRIIVPQSLRSEMLEKLHESHVGMTKTKLRARGILYWPGIDTDIENFISRCRVCERFLPAVTKEPLLPHLVPDLRFEKVASDICQLAGTIFGYLPNIFRSG